MSFRGLALAPWLAAAGLWAADPGPQPAPPAAYAEVGPGEDLYAVAARPEVYGDGRLYPLLVRANLDQLKDPRRPSPGLRLRVPRDSSAAEREKALEEAMTGEWLLPPPVRIPGSRAWWILLLALGLLAAAAWLRPQRSPR